MLRINKRSADAKGSIESGMHVPPADKLLQLAELFTTTTDYLLTGGLRSDRVFVLPGRRR